VEAPPWRPARNWASLVWTKFRAMVGAGGVQFKQLYDGKYKVSKSAVALKKVNLSATTLFAAPRQAPS
jgi:hypothetical protein